MFRVSKDSRSPKVAGNAPLQTDEDFEQSHGPNFCCKTRHTKVRSATHHFVSAAGPFPTCMSKETQTGQHSEQTICWPVHLSLCQAFLVSDLDLVEATSLAMTQKD